MGNLTKDYKEPAAWFEHNMPPMPGARCMYQEAVKALRSLPKIEAERDALLQACRDGVTCDNCRYRYETAEKCGEDMGPCCDCQQDCYCKECQGYSKWELDMGSEHCNG